MRLRKHSWLKALFTGIKEYEVGTDYIDDEIKSKVASAKRAIDDALYKNSLILREIDREGFIDEVVERINRKQLK